MNRKLLLLTVLTPFLVTFGAATSYAFPPSNPYLPTAADIQGMLDRTADFSGGAQASTSQLTNIPGGIELKVIWATGTPLINETFTRIVKAQRFPDDNGDGDGGDLDAFDGVSWTILSDTAVSVKPYSQDWDNFNFQEGDQPSTGCGVGLTCVPANTPTVVSIDWDDVGGTFAAVERTNVFEVGFQIFGPSPPQDGSTIASRILVTTLVPEPTAIASAGVAALTLATAAARRRNPWRPIAAIRKVRESS